MPFTAFARKKSDRVNVRLIVRRSRTCTPRRRRAGRGALFDVWRFHAFFTTAPERRLDGLGTVAADKSQCGHAIIEQVHADLKGSALAHLPSGRFVANGAWLVLAVIAFNLIRAAAHPDRGAEARESDHRDRPWQADPRPGPGRVSARGVTLRLPPAALARRVHPTVRPRRRPARHRLALTTRRRRHDPRNPKWNTPTARSGAHPHAHSRSSARRRHHADSRRFIGGWRLNKASSAELYMTRSMLSHSARISEAAPAPPSTESMSCPTARMRGPDDHSAVNTLGLAGRRQPQRVLPEAESAVITRTTVGQVAGNYASAASPTSPK